MAAEPSAVQTAASPSLLEGNLRKIKEKIIETSRLVARYKQHRAEASQWKRKADSATEEVAKLRAHNEAQKKELVRQSAQV